MQTEDPRPRLERAQTDNSLRVEREKADQTLEDGSRAIDETADAVISLARLRADDVLAATRATTDRQSSVTVGSLPISRILKSERVREDHVLSEERALADEILREERAEHVALLSRERAETDRDLSHERELSDDALAARDTFLGIVSHDLRNILNAIAVSAALIENAASKNEGSEDIVPLARRIRRSGVRMTRLVGDLVDIASIEAGMLRVMPEVGNPTILLTEAVETFQAQATAAGLSIATEIVPPVAPFAFDAARILQVISNLLSNAIKFTPAGGRIVVRLEHIAGDVHFIVSDTGVGIAADKLEAVFVRFLQVADNDRRGVGLGLYISRAIVEGHRGRIWAESTIGHGSTFRFTLPVHADR
jgi:signal transduction histidine kinase